MDERSAAKYNAQLAEQSERYKEMVEYMKQVVSLNPELDVEERNLLSVAYKNVVGARRASWRVLDSIEAGTDPAKESEKAAAAEYKEQVEKELDAICGEVVDLLNKTLLPPSLGGESKLEPDVEASVFYLKMGGDYKRYLAEFLQGEKRDDTIAAATKFYEQATETAKELAATDPIRLGLALNFSVFYYEIVAKKPAACKLAKEAFDNAVAHLDDLPEEAYKDATLIMQLLRDNLTLWDGSPGDDDNNDGNEDL